MKYLALLLVIISGLERIISKTIPLSDPSKTGATPRFTTDQRGRPVLSWVEKEGEKNQFFFSVSNDNGKTFGDKVAIGAPSNCSVHAEGMPRIAFKSDGTIYATFELKKPTKEAARASDLMYITSNDNGQTWSSPKALHRDTTPGKGHSFSDVARLPNGELGFVWLDDKLGKYEGRSVKFVQTLPNGGFSEEVVVDSNACQCCRTVVFVDHSGHIHLTYRDLNADGTRDMSHCVSNDGGHTFSIPKLVHSDLWKINACPHTGPSMTQVEKDLFVSWFSGTSANHEAGIRIAKLGQEKLYSSELSVRAKHPQSAAYQGSLAVVWDESMEKNDRYFSKIALRFIHKNGAEKTTYLTTDFDNASYPVLLSTSQGLLVAYELQKPNQEPIIVVSKIDPAL